MTTVAKQVVSIQDLVAGLRQLPQSAFEETETVRQLLQDRPVDADLRLKILQVVDELDRTVAIRAKYLNAP